MDQTTLDAIGTELKHFSPFEWLCVTKNERHDVIATYMMNQRAGHIAHIEFEPVFYRSINLRTQETVTVFVHPELSVETAAALMNHYSERYVLSDALTQLQEFASEHHMYLNDDGTSNMPTHEKFGKNVYHADLGQLNLPCNQFVNW